jgi:hypothetical protein
MRKWRPRATTTDPGAWMTTTMVNFMPTVTGSYAPPNLFTQKVGAGPVTPGTTKRAWCALLPDDTAIGYIGTTTKVYQYDGSSTFTDRSKGGGYTNTATDWSFAQYGYYSLATNRVDALQVRDSSGVSAFADCAGNPPKARIICTQSEQVLLADLNDGTEKGDSFASCAPGDHTDWSSANAMPVTRIRHRPGRLTAMVAFRDYVLAFKRSSVYKLTYTGSTLKWRVELIAIGRGAFGKHDVLNCGDIVLFNGPGGGWSFDGASFRSTTNPDGPVQTSPCIGSYFSPSTQTAYFMGLTTHVGYNVASEAWGKILSYTTTGTSLNVTYYPLTGEPAALSTFTGSTVGVSMPDVIWLVDLSSNPCVQKSDSQWGNGTSAFHQRDHVRIVRRDRWEQHHPFLDGSPRSSRFPRRCCRSPPLGDTALAMTYLPTNNADDIDNNGTSAQIASSTAQRRFDINISSVYLLPAIFIPVNAGYTEIVDYTLDMKLRTGNSDADPSPTRSPRLRPAVAAVSGIRR